VVEGWKRSVLEHHRQKSFEPHWLPTEPCWVETNLARLRTQTTGEPHTTNLGRWTTLVNQSDVLGMHRVMTGLDRDAIAMREVSPLGGLVAPDELSTGPSPGPRQ
jgi:hypothetical protein